MKHTGFYEYGIWPRRGEINVQTIRISLRVPSA